MSSTTAETCNQRYETFFEQEAKDISERRLQYTGDEKREPTHSGLSNWSPEEEEILFLQVELHGRGSLNEIVAKLPCKSKPEIQAFLNACAAETSHSERQRRTLNLRDTPAAVEVDPECQEALDDEADALAERQLQQDACLEERQYGDYWLLDEDCARSITNASYIAKPVLPGAFHGAHELLNLQSLLRLSTRLFMSSTDPEADWETYSPNGPSLFCSAFVDLHRLVVAVTKRLLASTLFIAESRLRATAGYSRRSEQVRRQDVVAAADVLGLHTQREYWIKAPRRCGWRVLAKEPDQWTDDACLGYAAVEAFLNSAYDVTVAAPTASGDAERSSSAEDQDQESTEEDKAASSDDPETVELDLQDKQASLRETQKICRELKMDVPEHAQEARLSSEPPPRKRRKIRYSPWDDSRDWRTFVEYQAEWEHSEPLRQEHSPSVPDQGQPVKIDDDDSESSGLS